MEQVQWQSLLMQGNDCFHNKQWSQAELFYSEAYDMLAVSYRINPVCVRTLNAWVCACHNLSSLYEAMEEFELALKFLMIPHEYFLKVTELENCEESFRSTAFMALSLTLPPILLFTQQHPTCDTCMEKLTSLAQRIKHLLPAMH